MKRTVYRIPPNEESIPDHTVFYDLTLVESGARRGSVQLGLSRQPSLRIKNKNGAMEGNLLMESAYESLVELEAKQKEMEEKHNQVSWTFCKRNIFLFGKWKH